MALNYEPDNKKIVIGQAFQAYNELTDEQRSIIDRKYIQGTHTADEWLKVLKGIAEYDALGDDAKKVAKPTQAGCVVVGVGFFAALILGNMLDLGEQVITGLVVAVLVIGGIILIYRSFYPSSYKLLANRDLPNHFRSFALPILVLLKEEIAADEPIDFWVDMREKNQQENVIQKNDPGKRGNTRTTFYHHNMVEIKTRFSDGTRFHFQLGDVVRKRIRSRRNARGKLKVKTKYKIKTQWRLKVALPKRYYALEKPDRNADDKSDPKRIIFKVQQTEIRTLYNYVPNVNFFINMVFTRVYKRVRRV